MIDDLKRVSIKINKKTVTMDEYKEYGEFHPTTLTRRFKSWFTRLELAGLEDSRSRINIADELLFNNLKDIWIKLGRQPKYHEMIKPLSQYYAGVYEDRFGTWYKALQEFISIETAD